MPDTALRTRLRLLPLLLYCMSGPALAAGLPPLQVAPDLLRPARQPAAAPATPAVPAAPTTPAAPAAPASRPAPAAASPSSAGETATLPRPASAEAAPPAPAGGAPAPAPAAGTGSAAPAAASAAPMPQQAPQQADGATEPVPAGSTSVSALRIGGVRGLELVADGDAELQRDDTTLTADRITYREPVDEVEADGNVVLKKGDDTIAGPNATLAVGEMVGRFESPQYTLVRSTPARDDEPARKISGSGQADVLRLEGENQYRLENATWTTCEASDPDWYLRARKLDLDYDRETGTARDASLVFKGVPIFWMPWADFPLTAQRQSGVLPPTIGSSNKTGLDVTVPYYWNIAPNYDATIAPRYMSRRGMQLGGEFRYLGQTYRGTSRVEWMPRDEITREERKLGSVQHQQMITPRLFGSVDLNAVSDDDYFKDLSSRIATSSRIHLLREGRLHYFGGEWWNASALLQSYQTLNPDRDEFNPTPYRRLPQLQLNAFRPGLPGGLVFDMKNEYVQFAHPDKAKDEAGRFTAYPQLSLPMRGAAWFVTPKAGVHFSRYSLDRAVGNPQLPESVSRTVPIISIDSGLVFEREARFFGSDFVQTLEPRLFYLRVPYRDQRDIPLFDTARYDVGFAQIFSDNRYTGSDRIGDANDLTAAVTSRLIDPATGAERLRVFAGQRYYFADQRVTQDYRTAYSRDGDPATVHLETPRDGSRADVLAGLGGRLTRSVSVDTYMQYNPRDSETERFNAAIRYQPDFAKALNVSYRYAPKLTSTDGTLGLEDVDISGQWPLGGGWYGVGRVTRSLKEKRVTEAIGGFEYNGGCWALRVAMHRFAVDANDVTKAVFIQLELNDLASIGSSPVNLIKRSVPGYGKINDSSSDRVFGVE